ncbi:MAG: hypothetical protein ACWA5U_11025 [bacterium]
MNRIASIIAVVSLGILLSACKEGRQLPSRSDNTLLNCPDEIKHCPDGSMVSRDPMQHCQFASCPVSDTDFSAVK